MEKPITVAREDLYQKIAEDVNTSGLPFFVINDILTQILQQCTILAKQQYAADKDAYEKSSDSNLE